MELISSCRRTSKYQTWNGDRIRISSVKNQSHTKLPFLRRQRLRPFHTQCDIINHMVLIIRSVTAHVQHIQGIHGHLHISTGAQVKGPFGHQFKEPGGKSHALMYAGFTNIYSMQYNDECEVYKWITLSYMFLIQCSMY